METQTEQKLKYDLSDCFFKYVNGKLNIDYIYDGELSYQGYVEIDLSELLQAMGYDVANGSVIIETETWSYKTEDVEQLYQATDIYDYLEYIEQTELLEYANKNQNKIILTNLN